MLGSLYTENAGPLQLRYAFLWIRPADRWKEEEKVLGKKMYLRSPARLVGMHDYWRCTTIGNVLKQRFSSAFRTMADVLRSFFQAMHARSGGQLEVMGILQGEFSHPSACDLLSAGILNENVPYSPAAKGCGCDA